MKSRRGNGKNRRKNQQKEQTATTTTTTNGQTPEHQSDEGEVNLTQATLDSDHEEQESFVESSNHQTDDEQQQSSSSSSMQQRTNVPPSNESSVPSKPQASVAPVKQYYSQNYYRSSYSNRSDNHGKYSSYNNYQNSNYNTLPPRFQQQRQREAAAAAAAAENQRSRYRRRRGGPMIPYRSSFYSSSNEQTNESPPSPPPEEETPRQDEEEEGEQIENLNHQCERSIDSVQHAGPVIPPDYSSGSENLSDVPSTTGNTSAGSQSSLRGIDLIRSLTNPPDIVDRLMSIFDSIPFSSDELELLISKIATKHILNKQEVQRLLTLNKTDQTLERLLDETYFSQVRILAVELQAEKNRVNELTKSNADLDQTIRQLQQQQSQQPNLVQYQQMSIGYQLQLRRLADENHRFQQQMQSYAMLPAMINELRQQNQILTEQLRQFNIRNSALENEASESERASKRAAEIYKKADAQKQEKIEQMIADINKYKKLDKELTALKQKSNETEKEFHEQIEEMKRERDDLREKSRRFDEQIAKYRHLQDQYEEFLREQSKMSADEVQRHLNDLKEQNDQLRQQNWKINEEINRLSAGKASSCD